MIVNTDNRNKVVTAIKEGLSIPDNLTADAVEALKEITLKEYEHLLKNTHRTPTVKQLTENVLYEIEVKALDVVYGENLLSFVTQENIYKVIGETKSVIHYFGSDQFDCQGRLFKNLYSDPIYEND